MNRLDTAQMAIPQVNTRVAETMVWATYVCVGLACVMSALIGVRNAHNPTDQFFASVALLPLWLLLLDAWTVIVAFTRRLAQTPLRVPLKTPVILSAVHLLSGLGAMRLVKFETIYTLVEVSDRLAHYQVRWTITVAVIGLSLVALLLSVFEVRLVRLVLLSEITSAGLKQVEPVSQPGVVEDLELGMEHVYEAQVLLNNLGYEVSPISGELNASTVESLKQFQMIVDLEATGKLTAKSMIELRNRWREQEEESSPMMAVSGHAVKRTSSRIAGFFKRS